MQLLASSLIALFTSVAHASVPACYSLFSEEAQLVSQLASLESQARTQADPAIARLLYSQYQTKLNEARKVGIDLSKLRSKTAVLVEHEERQTSERRAVEERMRKSRKYREDQPVIETAPIEIPHAETQSLGLGVDTMRVFFRLRGQRNQVDSQDRYGNRIAPLKVQDRDILSLIPSPDGQYLSVGYQGDGVASKQQTVLYRVATGEPIGTWDGWHSSFSHDGALLAVESGDRIKVLRLTDLSEMADLESFGDVQKLDFSGDKQDLYVASVHNRATMIRRISLSTKSIRQQFPVDLYLGDISVSSDGKQIMVSELQTKKIRVYDTTSAKLLMELEVPEHSVPVGVSFLDHDSLIVAVTSKKLLMVWSAIDGKLQHTRAASDRMLPSAMKVSADRKKIFVQAVDQAIRVFEVNESEPF